MVPNNNAPLNQDLVPNNDPPLNQDLVPNNNAPLNQDLVPNNNAPLNQDLVPNNNAPLNSELVPNNNAPLNQDLVPNNDAPLEYNLNENTQQKPLNDGETSEINSSESQPIDNEFGPQTNIQTNEQQMENTIQNQDSNTNLNSLPEENIENPNINEEQEVSETESVDDLADFNCDKLNIMINEIIEEFETKMKNEEYKIEYDPDNDFKTKDGSIYTYLIDDMLNKRFGLFHDTSGETYSVRLCIYKINSDSKIPYLNFLLKNKEDKY